VQKNSERRAFPRYSTMERALLAMGQDRESVFHLLDISRGGIGFRYIGNTCRTAGVDRVDLYHHEKLWLDGVPVQSVDDLPLSNGTISYRRCGLRFAELTDEQIERLESFMGKVVVD
jgi:c-di-GMP-binding flagellar brake protein YcgR